MHLLDEKFRNFLRPKQICLPYPSLLWFQNCATKAADHWLNQDLNWWHRIKQFKAVSQCAFEYQTLIHNKLKDLIPLGVKASDWLSDKTVLLKTTADWLLARQPVQSTGPQAPESARASDTTERWEGFHPKAYSLKYMFPFTNLIIHAPQVHLHLRPLQPALTSSQRAPPTSLYQRAGSGRQAGVQWPRQLRNWVLCSPEHQHTDPHLLISKGFFRNTPPTTAWRPVCYQNTRGKTTCPPSCVTVKRKINCPISAWWHSLSKCIFPDPVVKKV